MIDTHFWSKRRVFLTGHTGFKGSWMTLLLNQLGSNVKGFALTPPTKPSLFNEAFLENVIKSDTGDIRHLKKLTESIRCFEPEVVIHMAAQPLVRQSYKFPIETLSVNALGTANLLQACLECRSVKSVVVVTTDKCYENKEWIWAYREDDPVGGFDPYSSSKGCAELITSSYRNSFYEPKGVGLASARAGNVIAGGDWAKDRLIPDILRAFEREKSALIRNPDAIRPWQHVLEPLTGYLSLAQQLYQKPTDYASSWNFGPNDNGTQSVRSVLNKLVSLWPQASWDVDCSENNPHEASTLKLDITKAKTKLDWAPVWSLDTTLEKIVFWHRAWLNGENMQRHSIDEISQFLSSCAERKLG
jgi:CDP-glucose 4,6-dehydratase